MRASTLRAVAPVQLSPLSRVQPHAWCPGDGDSDHLGGDTGEAPTIELVNGLFEVGRAEPADIVIPVPSVSGRHAMLRVGALPQPAGLPWMHMPVYADINRERPRCRRRARECDRPSEHERDVHRWHRDHSDAGL